jgi:transposase-like protein
VCFVSKILTLAAEAMLGSVMSGFDYTAPAELFAARGRSGLRYRRFLRAADAIRYAVVKLPSNALSSARLEVEQRQYDASQIRALYESANFPPT